MEHRDATASGEGNKIRLTHHLQFPHSLGLLYSAFTYYCGFKVNSGEYKLMGLAPYGQPVYEDLIFQHLIDLKPDGSFWLNMDYFNYCQGLTMTEPAVPRRCSAGRRASRSRRSSSGTWTWPPASRRSPRRSCCAWAGDAAPADRA